MIRKVEKTIAPTLLFSPSLQTLIAHHFLSIINTYYKYYKTYSWKTFSQENVFGTVQAILKNASSRKLNQDTNIVKTKLSND